MRSFGTQRVHVGVYNIVVLLETLQVHGNHEESTGLPLQDYVIRGLPMQASMYRWFGSTGRAMLAWL